MADGGIIPVFGLPILNRPELLQNLFNTIDYPIGRLFIIDNGGILKGSKLKWPWDVKSVHVTDPGYNIGVAASWNHIIKANMNAPWWMISSNDMQHESGSLQRLAELMESAKEPTVGRLQIVNEDWGNAFGTFALNSDAVETLGWFDENLHPIYFEDTDYMRRAEALNVSMPLVPSKTFHRGNESWKGNAPLAAANKKSWDGNVKYFDSKWAGQEIDSYHTEWIPPKLSRLRQQAWEIERTDSGPT